MKYIGTSLKEELKRPLIDSYFPHASYPNSVILDGTTDYLEIQVNTWLSLNSIDEENQTAASWSMWFKGSSQNMCFFSKDAGTNTLEYRMFLLSNKVYFDTHTNSAGNYTRTHTATDTSVMDGSWNHIVFTINEMNLKRIYLNGVEMTYGNTGSGGTYTGPNNESSSLWIGHMTSSAGYDFSGNIMNVCMWTNYELNPWEVKHVYGVEGGNIRYPNLNRDTEIYKGASRLALWLTCQESVSFSYMGSSYTGIANSATPYSESTFNRPGGGEFKNQAAIDTNDSPTT